MPTMYLILLYCTNKLYFVLCAFEKNKKKNEKPKTFYRENLKVSIFLLR